MTTRDELAREFSEALREASREELLITTDESVWLAEAAVERIWPRLERAERIEGLARDMWGFVMFPDPDLIERYETLLRSEPAEPRP